MTWLASNWPWIALALGALLVLRRTGAIGSTSSSGREHGEVGGGHGDHLPRPGDASTATDPVTGREIPAARAVTSVYGGQVYYFETQQSRQRFEASPEQYTRGAGGRPLHERGTANGSRVRRHGGC